MRDCNILEFLVKLRPSYNGITLASQARDAGSTPVGRYLDKLDKDCYQFLVFNDFIKVGRTGVGDWWESLLRTL